MLQSISNNSQMDSNVKESLQSLVKYLTNNQLYETLNTLKAELLSSIPSEPSDQLLSIIKNVNAQEHVFERPNKVKRMNDQEANAIMEKLVNRWASSEKIINDQQTNLKIEKLMDQPAFKRLVNNTNVFDNQSQAQSQSNAVEFHDELDFVVGTVIPPLSAHNIPINYELPFKPSEERDPDDQYLNDNDFGYVAHRFLENEYFKVNGGQIGYLALQTTMPTEVVKRDGPPHKPRIKKLPINIKSIKPPADAGFPLSCEGIDYNCMNLKVIYNRQKTGYEENREFPVVINNVIAGRYQILQKLGSGAFATAVKVNDLKQNGKITCLKIFTSQKQTTDQGFDQLRLLALINANCDTDKNYLLKYHESFYHREHLFVETELLGQQLFKTYRQTPQFFTMPIIKQTAKMILIGLNQLHRMNIIHCDLKPENILIKSYQPYSIKIVDMGNACFFHDDFHNLYMQSRNYRAPELLCGISPTEKIDIWSLGCILAQLWTKKVLFRGEVSEMMARMQGIRGPWPSWMLQHDKRKPSTDDMRFTHQCTKKLIVQRSQMSLQEISKFNNSKEKHIISHLMEGKVFGNKPIPIVDVLIPKSTSLSQRLRCGDEDFVSFLEQLLTLDPTLRPSAEQALKHKFLEDVIL